MSNAAAVKEKIDIVDLISSYIPVKKAGKNYRANCPFHNEKTPSFMISEELQNYRCFGCGKNGDIFTFVQEIEGIDFPEALKLLADRAGIEIKYDKKSAEKNDEKQRLIKINELTADFYNAVLTKHEFGKPVLEYLKNRGVKKKTIEEFKIGYAPKSWESLSKFLIAKKFTHKELVDAGVAKFRKDNKSTYDIFRGRLVVPLYDHMGKCVGFSGRALEEDQIPKYLNTPETPVFHKEQFLFGLNLAKAHIRKEKQAIVTEGIFDMVMPYQEGFENTVASQGTALTSAQIKLVKRYAESLVLFFDNDAAGMDASIRALRVIQNEDIDIKVAVPEGDSKDPDEYVREDKRGFRKVVKNALPLWDYYFYYATQKFNLNDVFEKKKASNFLLVVIKEISDEVIKAEYIKKFATLFEVDESSVIDQMKTVKSEPVFSETTTNTSNENTNQDQVIPEYPQSETYLLALLAKVDADKAEVFFSEIEEDYFSNDDTRELFKMLKHEIVSISPKKLDIKGFYDRLTNSQPRIYKLFETVYLLDLEEYLQDPESIDSEVAVAIKRLKTDYLKRELKNTSRAIAKAEASSDFAQLKELQETANRLTQNLRDISS